MVTSNHSLRQEPFRPPKPIFPPHFNNHISWLKCFVNRPRWDRAFQPTVKLWSLTLGLYSHIVISATLICPAYIPIIFFHLLKTDLSDQHVYSAYDHIVKFHTLRLYFTLCKGIQSNLGFWIWRRGFRIPCTRCKFLSVEREFQMPIVIRRITDSNSKRKKFPDFPFRKQKSPGFWNPDFLILDDVFLHRFTWEEEKCGI